MRQRLLMVVSWAAMLMSSAVVAQEKIAAKKVVLIAGTVHQGPGGHPAGSHEYEKSVRLLAHWLRVAPSLSKLDVETHFDGWPEDAATLNDADTIVLLSDGADRNEADHPWLVEDRLQIIDRQMQRGCGLVVMHWSLFVPNEVAGSKFLEWIGGYFDYQSGAGPRPWFSKIQTARAPCRLASPEHPIVRGLASFELREEFYYNMRMRPGQPGLTPILATSLPDESDPQVVAWALERPAGGRGFGFTGGHFFDNWQVPEFRRLVLGAIAWTAGIEVPQEGINAGWPADDELANIVAEPPLRVLIVTGHQHPAHDWRETTKALQSALGRDGRCEVDVVVDPDAFAKEGLSGYDALLLNYCNWERPGLSDTSRDQLVQFVRDGGGLVLVHFANGAFREWPEYRQLCRRVWVDGASGHDAYGTFRVEIVDKAHPITDGLKAFETIDELYYGQQGDAPIEVLATARSNVTGRDEPMAFVYEYGQGRVFQMVLGHAAESLRVPDVAALVRRGAVWAAGRRQEPEREDLTQISPPSSDTLVEGRFGKALNGTAGGATASGKEVYRAPPLTVECWARLDDQHGFNILVACDPKESADHWEIYSYAGTGEFSAFLPGYDPAEIRTRVDIVDGTWHHVALAFDGSTAWLYVDGQLAREATVRRTSTVRVPGALWFGAYPPRGIPCRGRVDDVRISNAVRTFKAPLDRALELDDATIGLWRFDAIDDGRVVDESKGENAAGFDLAARALPEPAEYRLDDERLKVVTLDRSANDSFLCARTDSTGQLFVGGREALFVYERLESGAYGRQKLLYRFPPHSWLADIQVRGDDLYVMTSSALYLLPGVRTRHEGVVPQRLIWGLPLDLHVSYHAMAWGPEGDLYFTAGDPLLNYGDYNRPDHWGHWTIHCQPEGTQVPYTGVGGVFRCRPDGSGFEVVAGGTRGSFGLAFDDTWNLFTNDNDHESLPALYTPARLLHVVPQADFAWPRGWTAERSPDRTDLLTTVFHGMGRGVPVGQTYYGDTLLPREYRSNLFVARWGRSAVTRYPLVRRGASYAADEHIVLEGEQIARPVGVTAGFGGRLYATVSYMSHNEWSPTYPTDLLMITTSDDQDMSAADPGDITCLSDAALWKELSHVDWSRRYNAHVELLRRGDAALAPAVQRLATLEEVGPAAAHIPWLAGASGNEAAWRLLMELTEHDDSAFRAQAWRVLTEYVLRAEAAVSLEVQQQLSKLATRALEDDEPQVVQAVVLAHFYLDGRLPKGIARLPARSDDTYLRQAATRLLARRAEFEELAALCAAEDAAGRLAGVLAVGTRLTVPHWDWIPPGEVVQPYANPNAEMEIRYADKTINLREHATVGSFTMAEAWRLMRRTTEQDRAFKLLLSMVEDEDRSVRLQAAHYLYLLNDSRSEPIVARVVAQAHRGRLAAMSSVAVGEAWMLGPWDDGAAGLATAHTVERGAVDLSAEYSIGDRTIGWQVAKAADGRFSLPRSSGPQSSESHYGLLRLQTISQQTVLLRIEANNGVKVWHNGALVYENAVLRSGQRFVNSVYLDLVPGSNDVLVRVQNVADAAEFVLAYSALNGVVATLPDKVGSADLARRLQEAAAGGGAASLAAEFAAYDWHAATREGDVARGAKLFGIDGLGCAKCHASNAEEAGGGAPSLAGAGQRFTLDYLVESILLPNKQVAPIFRSTTIQTTDGLTTNGLIVSETSESVELLQPDAKRMSVAKSEIESRELSDLSAMPSGIVATPDELRDLLAFLLSR